MDSENLSVASIENILARFDAVEAVVVYGVHGLALAAYAALTYLVAVRAFWRILRRENSWHKTARNSLPAPGVRPTVGASSDRVPS